MVLERVKKLETLFSKYEITAAELAKVKALEEKLVNSEMTVSVIGQFKRGKSTMVNAILQEKIMPVGFVPVTAVNTSVRYGEKSARVHFENGAVVETPFEEVTAYINEQENNDNKLGVAGVEMHVPAEFLKSGITLVDTPGVGSIHKNKTDAAYAFVKESDAVIFLLSVDSPINQIEIEFLERTKAYASKFYFAVNKADIVDEDELEDYLAYCKMLLCKLMEVDSVTLFPVSAKKNIGVQEMLAVVESDCKAQAKEIIEGSVNLKLKDIVESALRQITLYRTALNMPMDEFAGKFEEMKAAFDGFKKDAADFAGHFANNSSMLQAELNTTKNRLSAKVSELFGIEYHYDIASVELGDEVEQAEEVSGELNGEIFLSEVEKLCDELFETLNVIFMYREENAYTVVRRINDLNRLVRSLATMREELK